MEINLLIEALREHAVQNYACDGWDYLVECWDDEEIAEEIKGARTLKGAIRKVLPTLRLLNELRSEVPNKVAQPVAPEATKLDDPTALKQLFALENGSPLSIR